MRFTRLIALFSFACGGSAAQTTVVAGTRSIATAPEGSRKLTFALRSADANSADAGVFGCRIAPIRDTLAATLSDRLTASLRATGVKVATAGDAADVTIELSATVRCFAAGMLDVYKAASTSQVRLSAKGQLLRALMLEVGPFADVDFNNDEAGDRFASIFANDVATAIVNAPEVVALSGDAPRQSPSRSSAALALTKPTKMLVLAFRGSGDVQSALPDLVTRTLLSHLDSVQNLRTISTDDIETMLDVDKKKAAVGCDTNACMAEIGGALGAELVLYAQLAKIGTRYAINATIVNTRSATVRGRLSIMTEANDDKLVDALPELAAGVVAKLAE